MASYGYQTWAARTRNDQFLEDLIDEIVDEAVQQTKQLVRDARRQRPWSSRSWDSRDGTRNDHLLKNEIDAIVNSVKVIAKKQFYEARQNQFGCQYRPSRKDKKLANEIDSMVDDAIDDTLTQMKAVRHQTYH